MAKRAHLLSLLSAFLYVLASPPVDLEFLGWLCLVPLFFAVNYSNTPKEALKIGFTGGIAASIGLYYWLIHTMVTYGGLSFLLSSLVFFLLAIYLALYWAIFAYTVKFVSASNIPLYFAAPSIWVSLEYLRTYLFTGFPWALIGYTQYKSPHLIQLSNITGVYGVSFILALSSVIIYKGVKRFLDSRSLPYGEVAFLTVLVCLNMLYGVISTKSYKGQDRNITAALIQGNIEQAVKWDDNYKEKTLETYRNLSKKAFEKEGKLDIVIWPETAATFYFQEGRRHSRDVMKLSQDISSPLFFGSPAYRFEGKEVRYLNSGFLVAPDELGDVKVLDRYDKYHLVPFGEYVPLKKLLFFVNKITEGIGDFSPGEAIKPLKVSSHNSNDTLIAIGPLICYEGIFPNLVRQFVNEGANVLVNITNDAWYGRSSAPYQHLSAAVFRAVENGVYMLRAANTGITAIIGPAGKIEGKTALFDETYLTGRIALPEKKTFYTRYGDLFAMLTLLVVLLTVIDACKKRGKGEN